jgi:D-3-phosphoglycerate dehydrogenase / 2-oxoglutarate reductase
LKKLKVVLTDYEYKSLDEEKAVFEQAGIEFVAVQCRTEEEVIEAAKDADGLLNQYAPISRRVIESLPHLKVVSRYGIGVDTVDIPAATENGVIVANVTDYCLEEVSDHAAALILSAARKVVVLNQAVKNRNWNYNVGVPIFRLRGRTLGLVGFGNIPQVVAKKLGQFGLNIVAFDPFVSPEVADSLGVKLVSLEELCQVSDIISVHAPLNQHTRGMIKESHFQLMKPETFIVNTARGPIIDEQALIGALQSGKIAGAALDVVEKEPIDLTSPLLDMDNVILNPHVAWYSEESQQELQRKAAQNVADVLSGFFPHYIVNKEIVQSLALNHREL